MSYRKYSRLRIKKYNEKKIIIQSKILLLIITLLVQQVKIKGDDYRVGGLQIENIVLNLNHDNVVLKIGPFQTYYDISTENLTLINEQYVHYSIPQNVGFDPNSANKIIPLPPFCSPQPPAYINDWSVDGTLRIGDVEFIGNPIFTIKASGLTYRQIYPYSVTPRVIDDPDGTKRIILTVKETE